MDIPNKWCGAKKNLIINGEKKNPKTTVRRGSRFPCTVCTVFCNNIAASTWDVTIFGVRERVHSKFKWC